jgi:hypothetical protein
MLDYGELDEIFVAFSSGEDGYGVFCAKNGSFWSLELITRPIIRRMNPLKTSFVVVTSVVVVVALLGAAFLISVQPGAAGSTSATSTESRSTASLATGAYVNSSDDLQLRLSVNASSAGSDGNVTVQMRVDEYNTLMTANNVSAATGELNNLTLGSCGRGAYPFGMALYSGVYTAGNLSRAEPLQIHPIVPCPMFIRLVTGYLFQPASDLAVVLPSGPNATATEMSANVTATGQYGVGPSPSSSVPLGPGTYTAVAGDEWGSLVVVHFTIGAGTSAASTGDLATLGAQLALLSVGASAWPISMVRAIRRPSSSV